MHTARGRVLCGMAEIGRRAFVASADGMWTTHVSSDLGRDEGGKLGRWGRCAYCVNGGEDEGEGGPGKEDITWSEVLDSEARTRAIFTTP